jgi:hypothetical protein
MMYEEAKLSKKPYIHCLLRLQGSFRGHGPQNTLQNHERTKIPRMIYPNMRTNLPGVLHLLHDATWQHIDDVIQKGTLQGNTLSHFLFTIRMEPLLRWLSIGSRGYKPVHHSEQPKSTYITYDDHGYADDIILTIGTLKNL